MSKNMIVKIALPYGTVRMVEEAAKAKGITPRAWMEEAIKGGTHDGHEAILDMVREHSSLTRVSFPDGSTLGDRVAADIAKKL